MLANLMLAMVQLQPSAARADADWRQGAEYVHLALSAAASAGDSLRPLSKRHLDFARDMKEECDAQLGLRSVMSIFSSPGTISQFLSGDGVVVDPALYPIGDVACVACGNAHATNGGCTRHELRVHTPRMEGAHATN
jgi:hypothetical protein